jgi:hypothetical protein
MRRSRQIKIRIPILLSRWGLLPKFKRWRLAQDPETGMVVLFGVLNIRYIATHTTTPFSNYFDPSLLRDMAAELHVQVISSSNDGMRYAFILEKGRLGLPGPGETIEHLAGEQSSPQPNNASLEEDHLISPVRLNRFLQVAEAFGAMNNGATQPPPDILLMDEAEFNQKMAEYESNRNINNLQIP